VRLGEELCTSDASEAAQSMRNEALLNLGALRVKRREFAAAEQVLRQVSDRLAVAAPNEFEPPVTSVCRGLASIYLARAHQGLGQPALARAAVERGLALLSEVNDGFPGFVMTWKALSIGHSTDASLHYAAGRFAEATVAYDRAVELLRRLAEVDSDALRHRADLGIVLLGRANALRDAGRRDEARACLDEAIVSQSKVLAIEPQRPDWIHALFNQLYTRSLILWSEDPAAAAADARHMGQLQPDSGAALYIVAGLLARCAGQTVDPVAAEGLVVEALDALRRAIAAGWWDAQALASSRHLDVIRSRDEYRQLVESGPPVSIR
jgi:tetratricopeptide (TPR) repeat protein